MLSAFTTGDPALPLNLTHVLLAKPSITTGAPLRVDGRHGGRGRAREGGRQSVSAAARARVLARRTRRPHQGKPPPQGACARRAGIPRHRTHLSVLVSASTHRRHWVDALATLPLHSLWAAGQAVVQGGGDGGTEQRYAQGGSMGHLAPARPRLAHPLPAHAGPSKARAAHRKAGPAGAWTRRCDRSGTWVLPSRDCWALGGRSEVRVQGRVG